jgi:hypothetical protein
LGSQPAHSWARPAGKAERRLMRALALIAKESLGNGSRRAEAENRSFVDNGIHTEFGSLAQA